jgi:hypothetical protein
LFNSKGDEIDNKVKGVSERLNSNILTFADYLGLQLKGD